MSAARSIVPGFTEPASNLKFGRSVSLVQAAQLLQVSRRTVYNRIKDGQLTTVRARGSQRVLVSSLYELGVELPMPGAPNRHSVQY